MNVNFRKLTAWMHLKDLLTPVPNHRCVRIFTPSFDVEEKKNILTAGSGRLTPKALEHGTGDFRVRGFMLGPCNLQIWVP